MGIKSRNPQRLSDSDYISWFREIVQLKATEEADGTWPAHLTTDLAALLLVFEAAYQDYQLKSDYVVREATPALDDATKPLFLRIRSLKEALPTLFGGDKTVLAEFGIATVVPVDRDDLYNMASICVNHWNEIIVPTVPPEYLPVEPMFIAMQAEYLAFCTVRDAHIDATRKAEAAQNLKLEEREACNDAERLVFHWKRALYLDTGHQYWTATPWGGGSGGEEPEEPGGNPWPNPLTGLNAEINILGHPSVKADEQSGAVAYNVYVAVSMIGEPIGEKPEEAEWHNVSQASIMDTQHKPGTVKTYWACGVNEMGLEGEFCDPVSVELV